MIVKCQICGLEIAQTSLEELSVPISGKMFHPHRAGFPEPFVGGPDWMYIRCRYCRARPFLRDDEVLTRDGIYKIGLSGNLPDDVKESLTAGPDENPDNGEIRCGICGKRYTNNPKGRGWYNKHIEACNG